MRKKRNQWLFGVNRKFCHSGKLFSITRLASWYEAFTIVTEFAICHVIPCENEMQTLTRAVRGSDYSPAIVLSEEKDKSYKLKIGKTEKGRNNEMKKYEQPDFSIHNTLYLFFMFVTLYCFNFLSLPVLEKTLWKLSIYTIHPPIVHVGITFLPSRPNSSWERCDKNILMFENWRERKMKK